MALPAEVARMATAIASSSGDSTISPIPATAMSSERFRRSVERETSQVLYSTIGRSATWFNWTAVPNMPRTGGMTLSLIPSRRQIPINFTSIDSSIAWEARMMRSTPPSHPSSSSNSSTVKSARSREDAYVDVVEELQLSSRRGRELARSDDDRAGRWSHLSPRNPHAAAEGERDRGDNEAQLDGERRRDAHPGNDVEEDHQHH